MFYLHKRNQLFIENLSIMKINNAGKFYQVRYVQFLSEYVTQIVVLCADYECGSLQSYHE